MSLKAVLFDLFGTLIFRERPITGRFVSDFLGSRGYDVHPQALEAALHYVSMIDYPKHGFETWKAWLSRVAYRLGIEVDNGTLEEWTKLYAVNNWKLYPDAEKAVAKAKQLALETAVVTTTPKFMYSKALQPILDKIDLLVDGFTFRCEKSNPKIYRKTLETLQAKPEEAVMIGDDPDLDILVPKRLGLRTILLNRNGIVRQSNKVKSDVSVDNLSGALELIEHWVRSE